ncbi:hypothetical protein A9P82_01870 [Arachidicoccus ginsenosidimutans]|uniref:hypothetical protein n=1 Tax=Arachidicoccus sp. BS20 TaxID=1850526 RepID=UPI0007F1020A|nr:hypothetical protein [Arachidicoccus sp. BS20]ANI88167.1 hypothetical protein A9P82_01870 [Arachidicoccus sp. BS20]
MLDTGFVQIQTSKDDCKTWSAQYSPSINRNTIFLGASLNNSENGLLFSVGSYWKGNIYFTNNLNEDNIKPIAQISDSLISAMTVLANNKENIAIGWQKPHHINELYISYSNNKGKNWSAPILLAKHGALLTINFDKKDNLRCIYDDFENNHFSVIHEIISFTKGNINRTKRFIKVPTEEHYKDYIGAFQQIIYSSDNKKGLAFWIDFSDNNKLYCTPI